MRAIQLTEFVGGPQDLLVTELADPVPKPHEYLIAIKASAANFFDLLQIRGKYQHQPPFPWISGSEFSGVVLKTPTLPAKSRSPRYAIGDRVFGAGQGSYATKIAVAEDSLKPIPDSWNFSEAAGLFVTAPTSYAGLVLRAQIRNGDYVLVHAAAGGVGLAAVQIAKAFGATVIATVGSERKLHVAKSFGADYAISYAKQDWPEKVRKLTPNGRGVDIVYDSVGLVALSMKCITWNGRLVVVGFAGGELEKVATNRILLKNISVVGLHWGMYSKHEPETVDEVWKNLFYLIRNGKFQSTCFTDQDFVGLESVPKALSALQSRDTWGKIMIRATEECGSKL